MSIASPPRRTRAAAARPDRDGPLSLELATLVLVVLAMFALYAQSNPARNSPYDHFVRQADAFLRGRAAITLPDPTDPAAPANGYYQDSMPVVDASGRPTGEALLPFPPLPAVLLMPFVALFGLATNAQWVSTILGALVVGLAYRMLGRLAVSEGARLIATVFLGAGTVLWYSAAVGTTWFLAHLVAMALAFPAVELALEADVGASELEPRDEPVARPTATPRDRLRATLHGLLPLDRRQVAAGLLLGLAATARLPVLLGAPFLLFVGGGGSFPRRLVSAGAGLAVPLLGLAAFDLVSTGHLFHPAYDYQYQAEAWGYPALGYHPNWAIEDIRYLPQNLALMLGRLPELLPACGPGGVRGIFDVDCPYARPEQIGMSLLVTSPAWLLALAPLADYGRVRVVTGAAIAVGSIALIDLMHFSQGWVQFGYRFSNDFAPFALPLLALGIDRLGARRAPLVLAPVGLSVLVNLWGVVWSIRLLGW